MGMTLQQQINLAREKGFVFDNIRAFIGKNNREALAQDAAMMTSSNSGVPAALTAYVDPVVIEILTAPRNSRKIFSEAKKGDWATSHAQFKVMEMTGGTSPYTDYGAGTTSDINPTFPIREQYIFETTIRYGVREQAVTAKAMIDLASEKQKAAATAIDIDSNKFNLLGVEGREIYGLINEPNIPPTLAPASIGGDTLWSHKKTVEIYDDIIALLTELVSNSNGLIDANSELVLAVPPAISVQLGKATDFNVSVLDMLNKYMSNLEVAVLPELASATAGNMVMLTARSVAGVPTGQFGFSEKMRPLQIIAQTSSWEQKIVGTTYGCILYRPFAVATMTGV